MPVLYLTEDDLRQILTMEMAIDSVESGLRKMALEEAFSVPRTRCQTDHVMLHVLPAAAKTLGYLGYKAYSTTKQGARFHVTLYDGRTGEMVAFLQADYLGQMRTGAASAVATKYLARSEASTIGLFGSGKQARTQLIACCKVRPIERAYVYSPNLERCKTFASDMAAKCGVDVIAVSTPEDAARSRDIVITATSSRDPVLKGDWISEGQHLNVVGSNFLSKSEIDVEVIKKTDLIFIDHRDQGKLEAGDFIAALDQHVIEWSDIQELGRLIVSRTPGRSSPHDVTLFKSLGIGLEDIAVAGKVLEKAKEAGIGKWLEL